ncbi:MAG: FAD-dependent oxidoreductase [Pirellulales bacterium]
MLIPKRPLTEILATRLLPKLCQAGLHYRPSTAIRTISRSADGMFHVKHFEQSATFDAVVVAVPWNKVRTLIDDALAAELPELDALTAIPAAPIASVHLRFDHPITDLPHIVLPGRLSQWLFAVARPADASQADTVDTSSGYAYQVVVSAAYELMTRPRDETAAAVVADLRDAFPAVRNATLLGARVILEPRSVFAPRPGVDALRPPNASNVPGLLFAGDWTATGWPATMESAVRSGVAAARAVTETPPRSVRYSKGVTPRSIEKTVSASARSTHISPRAATCSSNNVRKFGFFRFVIARNNNETPERF